MRVKRQYCALGVVVGVVWRKVKKGANKALGRDENSGKEVEEDVVRRDSWLVVRELLPKAAKSLYVMVTNAGLTPDMKQEIVVAGLRFRKLQCAWKLAIAISQPFLIQCAVRKTYH